MKFQVQMDLNLNLYIALLIIEPYTRQIQLPCNIYLSSIEIVANGYIIHIGPI